MHQSQWIIDQAGIQAFMASEYEFRTILLMVAYAAPSRVWAAYAAPSRVLATYVAPSRVGLVASWCSAGACGLWLPGCRPIGHGALSPFHDLAQNKET